MESSSLSRKILKKFNILSILIGITGLFVATIFTSTIALILGIIAKRDKQKGAIIGIILGALGPGLLFICWIIEDISVGNYEALTSGIIAVATIFILKHANLKLW